MRCSKFISAGLLISLICLVVPGKAQQVSKYNLAAMLQKEQLITTPANQTKAPENSRRGEHKGHGMVKGCRLYTGHYRHWPAGQKRVPSKLPRHRLSWPCLPVITRPAAANWKPGTGLGLYLCKQLVSLQDGEISVESETGKGCIIRLTIPYAGVIYCLQFVCGDRKDLAAGHQTSQKRSRRLSCCHQRCQENANGCQWFVRNRRPKKK